MDGIAVQCFPLLKLKVESMNYQCLVIHCGLPLRRGMAFKELILSKPDQFGAGVAGGKEAG